MPVVTELERGRASFAQRKWRDAYQGLAAADRDEPLAGEDLERLATAAYLVGQDAASEDALVRAHNEFLRRGDTERAVRNAFWIAFALFGRGEDARGSGWAARARRLLEADRNCVEQGYLLVPEAIDALFSGEPDRALRLFIEITAFGERFSDVNLVTLGRMGQGQALVDSSRTREGVALFDEVMVAVTTGEVSPMLAGLAYCAIIDTCSEIYDLKRAHEWTAALSQWCASQPEMIPYRGQCLVRRAEIMQLHGDWSEAMHEVARARDTLAQRGERAVGAALYQQAELLRLRGAFSEAEECYRQASQWGRKPYPGLALLRLAQGQTDTAKVAISRVLDEASSPRARCKVLAA